MDTCQTTSMNKPADSKWVNKVKVKTRLEELKVFLKNLAHIYSVEQRITSLGHPFFHYTPCFLFCLWFQKLKHIKYDFMHVAVGNFMSPAEHLALLPDATGWSHTTTMYFTRYPTHEMYVEQPGNEKRLGMSMFIYYTHKQPQTKHIYMPESQNYKESWFRQQLLI